MSVQTHLRKETPADRARRRNPITAPLFEKPSPTPAPQAPARTDWAQIAADLEHALATLSAGNPFRQQIEQMIPQARENAERARDGKPPLRLRLRFQNVTIETGDNWEPGQGSAEYE